MTTTVSNTQRVPPYSTVIEADGNNAELDDIKFANLTIATRTHPAAIHEYNHQIKMLQVKIKCDKRHLKCLNACREAVMEYEQNSGLDGVPENGVEGSSTSVGGMSPPGRRINQYILCSNTVNDAMNGYLLSSAADYGSEVLDTRSQVAQAEVNEDPECSGPARECTTEATASVQYVIADEGNHEDITRGETILDNSSNLNRAAATVAPRTKDTESTFFVSPEEPRLPVIGPANGETETCPIALKRQNRRATAAKWRKANPRKVQKASARGSYRRKALNSLFNSGETATSGAVNALVDNWMREWEINHPEQPLPAAVV